MLSPKEFYNRTAGIYNLRHENPYTKLLRKKEIKLLKKYARGRTFDFGCGTGFHLNFLGDAVGMDISRKMLKIAGSEKPLLIGDENLPFRKNSFDTIICFLTVLNMCNYRKAVRGFSSVLKPGGIVITSVASIYDNNGLKEKTVNVSGNKMKLYLFDKWEIEKEFEKNGFEVLYFGSIFRVVKPLWGNLEKLDFCKKLRLKAEFLAPDEKGCMYLLVLGKREEAAI